MDQTGPAHTTAVENHGGVNHDAAATSGLDFLRIVQSQAKLATAVGHDSAHSAAARADAPHAQAMGQFLRHVSFSRGEDLNLVINHKSLNSQMIFESVRSKDPTFKSTESADGTRTLSDIKGISLKMRVFGSEHELQIKNIEIKKQADGGSTYLLKLQNPLPVESAKVFNSPDTIPLSFSTDKYGRVIFPNDSEIFQSLAGQAGGTLPGMVMQDAMKDASSVARFIETNPAWVKNIMAPFADRFGDYLKAGLDASAIATPTAQPPLKAVPTNLAPAKPGAPALVPANPAAGAPVIGRAVRSAIADTARAIENGTPKDAPGQNQLLNTFKAVDISKPGDYQQKIKILDRERTFSIHVPPGYDAKKPMPMILMVHGMSQTGAALQEMIKSNKLADKEGFIAVYPDSINWFNIKDLRTWETGNGLVLPGQKADDVRFMGKVIDATKAQLNVDPMRIYMAGFSNGGMLAFQTAAALSGTLASVAILSSTMSGKEPRPKEPLSLINIHGDADPIIPIEGLTNTPQILNEIGVPLFQPTHYATDYYKALNGITEPYTVTHSGKLTIETASNPANGTAVEQITVAGADHFLGNTDALLQQTWDFLKAHPRTKAPQPADNAYINTDTKLENLTAMRQLKADIKARGMSGIESDVDNIFDAARTIKDFNFSPSKIFEAVSKSTYVNFSDPVSTFLQNTTSISKKGDQLSITRKSNTEIPLNLEFGVGALKTLTVGDVGFKLDKSGVYPAMLNIQGLTVHAQVAGHNLSSRVEALTELPDGPNGQYGRIYEATMQNPLPAWLRTTLMSPKSFNVDVKFDVNMQPQVVNQNMTERQLLGRNPFINGIADEAQDVINMREKPSLGNAGLLTSDAAITGGLTYLGWRLGGSRARMAASLAFVAAPVAIDFIRKELTT